MSTVTLTMPRLGETMEEGTVSEWRITEGQSFERGAPLVEFETDKTAVEYPALGSGRLVKILVSPGALVRLGEPIAEIDLAGAEDWVSATDADPDTDTDTAPPTAGKVVIDLLMPRLGETMEEGKIISWMVKLGEDYARGASLLEVETDKTVAEFPALVPGRLVETLVAPGDTVKVDTPIARVEVAPKDAGDMPPAAEPEVSPAAATASTPTAPSPSAPRPAGERLRATPLARRAARQAGLDLNSIQGTGRRGRIELIDVTRSQSGSTGRLAAMSWGPANGTPTLLVHGFAGDSVTFEQLGKMLGRAGIAARAVDLPAHGKTPQEAQTFDDLVNALTQELDPARPVHLVGHSLGAATAIAATAATPQAVRSLTLIAPAGLGLWINGAFLTGMAEATSAGAIAHLLRNLSARAAAFSPATVAQIHADLARGRLTALASDLSHGDQQRLNLRAPLVDLARHMPVRILTGCEDAVLDWQDALDVAPEIALHVFARAGHMPHWDDPKAAAAIIAKGIIDD